MSLSPLPSMVVATEGYPPNLEVARARLNPLGVRVLPIREDQHIDLAERSVDLVLARHEAFDAAEVARVLRPGGTFVTQQIGPRNYESLDRWFGVASEPAYNHLGSLSEFGQEIAAAGFEVRTLREASWSEAFLDVGAVVYFLRVAPWEVPGFSVARFRPVLEGIHRLIQQHGRWSLEAHRFLAVAQRPGGPEATGFYQLARLVAQTRKPSPVSWTPGRLPTSSSSSNNDSQVRPSRRAREIRRLSIRATGATLIASTTSKPDFLSSARAPLRV